MNIFEELAESYTYNGVVSLKALDDDIVTLQNQIDSYNATLSELKLRGKRVSPLVAKIRDAKIRLSLLKAVYKRESDKTTTDDVILSMLGVSGRDAKEVSGVNTAADGREPKPQNFESAELEEVAVEQEVTDVKAAETEKVVDSEVVVTEEDEAEMQASVLQDSDSEEEVVVHDESVTDDKISEAKSGVEVEKTAAPVESGISVQVEPELKEGEPKTLDVESICKEVELVTVPAFQIPVEKDTKNVEVEKATKEQETKPVRAEKPLISFFKKIIGKGKLATLPDIKLAKIPDDNLKQNDIKSFSGCNDEVVENTEVIPLPTIDDYHEPELGPSYEEVIYDETGPIYNYPNDEALSETLEVVHNDENGWIQGEPSGTVVCEEDSPEIDCEKTYEPFYPPDDKIYASFDLHNYTDLVNTNSITGTFSEKHKVIELNFTDVRDYEIFTFFLNEKNQKCAFFNRLVKKPKSIIMYVRTEVDGTEKEYRYEFTGCRLVEVFDSEYKSMRESVYYPTATHEFYAKFKYKRLKIS